MFLLVNADAAFGAQAEIAKTILMVYLVLGNTMLIISKRQPEIFTQGIRSLFIFLIGFFLSAIVFIIIPSVFLASLSRITVAISFGFLYGFVVAFYEEMIFRDLLPKGLGFTDITANILFALFHLAALITVIGFVPLSILMAFIILFSLGMFWAFLRDRLGLFASIGSHLSYNLAVSSPALLGMIVIFKPV